MPRNADRWHASRSTHVRRCGRRCAMACRRWHTWEGWPRNTFWSSRPCDRVKGGAPESDRRTWHNEEETSDSTPSSRTCHPPISSSARESPGHICRRRVRQRTQTPRLTQPAGPGAREPRLGATVLRNIATRRTRPLRLCRSCGDGWRQQGEPAPMPGLTGCCEEALSLWLSATILFQHNRSHVTVRCLLQYANHSRAYKPRRHRGTPTQTRGTAPSVTPIKGPGSVNPPCGNVVSARHGQPLMPC